MAESPNPGIMAWHTSPTWPATDKQLCARFVVLHCGDGTCVVDHHVALLVLHILENNQTNRRIRMNQTQLHNCHLLRLFCSTTSRNR